MKNGNGITGKQARALRARVKVNQSRFWQAVGVTQSAGSRYEGERRIPQPIHLLLTLVYGAEPRAHDLLKKLRSMPNGSRSARNGR